MLTNLLRELVERNGSDLHLVPGSPPMVRIQGSLAPIDGAAIIDSEDVATLFDTYITERQRTALATGQDVQVSISAKESFVSDRYGEAGRFRASLYRDRNGIVASLRVIPTIIPTLSQLFTAETEATLRELIKRPSGLILVVGMVGSGKSTTTAAMIDAINRERGARIITLEDPIEYVHTSNMSLISQREVGSDVESYEQGGLSAMRADPDVVFVGEFRTPESVRIALALADTGHLVFATMHASSVTEAIRRMIESFPANRDTMQAMMARSLIAVIAQRLVPRANGNGRAPAHELLIADARIRRMINAGQTDLAVAVEAGRQLGMRSLDDSLLALYKSETISFETAWSHMQNHDLLGPIATIASN